MVSIWFIYAWYMVYICLIYSWFSYETWRFSSSPTVRWTQKSGRTMSCIFEQNHQGLGHRTGCFTGDAAEKLTDWTKIQSGWCHWIDGENLIFDGETTMGCSVGLSVFSLENPISGDDGLSRRHGFWSSKCNLTRVSEFKETPRRNLLTEDQFYLVVTI